MSKLMTRAAAVAAAVAVSALSTLAPATAATDSFTDKAGDIDHGADLRSVKVANGEENLRITLTARDLVRAPSSGAGGAVFIDTDGAPGPEYVMTGGFFAGTDYALTRTDSWKLREAGRRVSCSYSMRLDYDTEVAKFRMDKECFKAVPGSGDIRVEVRTSGQTADGEQLTDWLGSRRTFGPTIAQG